MSDEDFTIPDFAVALPQPSVVRANFETIHIVDNQLTRTFASIAPVLVREIPDIHGVETFALERLTSSLINALNGIQDGYALTITDSVQRLDEAPRRARKRAEETGAWAKLSRLLGYSVFVDQQGPEVFVVVDAAIELVTQLSNVALSNGYQIDFVTPKQLRITIP